MSNKKINTQEFLDDNFTPAPVQANTEHKSQKDRSFNSPSTSPQQRSRDKAETDAIKEDTSNKQANKEMKIKVCDFAMLITIISLMGWFAVIFLHIVGRIHKVEIFNDIQLATITTGCTVNILAVILGVIRGLFK